MDKSISSNEFIISASPERFSIKLAAILIAIHLLAIGCIFFHTKLSVELFIMAHFFFATFGVSLGYHRFLSHSSFKAKAWFQNFLATTATLCFQGGPIFWAAGHRAHHLVTEEEGDPHSAARGFLWSHCIWMCFRNPNGFSYGKAQILVPDLKRNSYFKWLEKNSTVINISVIIGSAVVFGLLLKKWDLFFWLIPLRIVTVWHSTWLINSFSHHALWIKKTRSVHLRNNIFMSILLGGEGYHRNHHDQPNLPKYKEDFSDLDFGYCILKLLKFANIVTFPNSHS